ncbi:AraC family transcriptional regulator [Actinomycetospora flava]|uniref:Helix-turn-helix transcriptional regulator n=1 Tax=Actinomycetospora flava TaxID=3129232 RepID=A0ABU8M8L5_9PSEU
MTSVSAPEAYEFATDDPETAYEMICARYTESTFRLSGHRAGFRLHIRGTDTDRFTLERMRQSVAFRTGTSPSEGLFVARPSAGRCQVTSSEQEMRFGAGETVLIDPHLPLEVLLDDVDYDVVRLDLGPTRALAADVSGLAPDRIRFRMSRPVSARRERHWHAVAEYVRRDVLGDDEIAASPLARAEAFRLLASTFVHTFPNAALDAVNDPTGPGPGNGDPAVVRRAMDFIEEHAGESIDVGDIAAAAGIGARGLQHSFRRHRGTTPRAHLRIVRLERAHRDLQVGDPSRGDTVSAIARRWGFTHLGRFTAAYRDHFDCLPSDTLRR